MTKHDLHLFHDIFNIINEINEQIQSQNHYLLLMFLTQFVI